LNITEPIRRRARAQPHAVAIVRANGQTISFAELEQRIDHAARHATELGMRAGDVIGLTLRGPLELIYALGLARIGVITASPELPRAHMRICLTETDTFQPGSLVFERDWTLPPPGQAAPPMPIHPGGPAICRIVGSSGTTGRAKFAAISHAGLAQRVFHMWLDQGPMPDCRLLAAGLSSGLGLYTALRCFYAGGTLVLCAPADRAGFITRFGVTSITATPFSLRQMLDALPADHPPFPTLRSIETGGDRTPPALWRDAAARICPTLINVLGATETGPIAAMAMAEVGARIGAVGHVFDGVLIEALDDAGAVLPPGRFGTLRIRAPAMVTHYVGADERAAASLREGWFYPGDTGAVEPDGLLRLAARVSEMINCGGEKIDPLEIEDTLRELPLVRDAAAFGVPDNFGVIRLYAAITAATRTDTAVLQAWCARTLPGRTPSVILQVPRLPRNENGKIIKDLLVTYALRQADGPADGTAEGIAG